MPIKYFLLLFVLLSVKLQGQVELYYSQVVKPENKEEEKLFAKYDTTVADYLHAYAKDYKGKPYPNLFSAYDMFDVARTINEYISMWPSRMSPSHEVFGLWNNSFDSLSVLGFSPLYKFVMAESHPCDYCCIGGETGTVLVDSSHFSGITPSFGDTAIVSRKDARPAIQYIKTKVLQKLNIKTINDTLMVSTHFIPIDTVILPQIWFGDLANSMKRKAADNGYWPFKDNNLIIRYQSRTEIERAGSRADTIQIPSLNMPPVTPTAKDSLNLTAFWDSVFKTLPMIDTVVHTIGQPEGIFVSYRWQFHNKTTEKYGRIPGFVLVRKPYSIGIHYKNGNVEAYKYNDIVKLYKYLHMPFNGLEQSFEAIVFNGLYMNPRRYMRCYKQ